MARVVVVVVMLVSLGWPAAARAQSQSDALGTCLADNTTGRDRKDLAKWLFLAMAAHPEITAYAAPDTAAASTESAKTIGGLVTRLLTESCANEAKAAIKSGGSAFEAAFRKLGEVAMQELMTDKSVTTAIGRFEQYLDQDRIKKTFGGQ